MLSSTQKALDINPVDPQALDQLMARREHALNLKFKKAMNEFRDRWLALARGLATPPRIDPKDENSRLLNQKEIEGPHWFFGEDKIVSLYPVVSYTDDTRIAGPALHYYKFKTQLEAQHFLKKYTAFAKQYETPLLAEAKELLAKKPLAVKRLAFVSDNPFHEYAL